MLTRINSFFDYFSLDESSRIMGEKAAVEAAEMSKGMMDVKDYLALAAVCLARRPRTIFEIGTYLGVTSNFFLRLLPECRVVSIAYVNPMIALFGKKSNNSDLPKEKVGSKVDIAMKSRFEQLYGDSHELNAKDMLEEHGSFDMILIDGDHSYDGVAQDTALARKMLMESGVLCWHDANPKEKYLEVREFLEKSADFSAIATFDDYIGGIACCENITQSD